MTLMSDFAFRAVLFAALESLSKLAGKRIEEENKIVIRRLVLERVLFSEVLYHCNIV